MSNGLRSTVTTSSGDLRQINEVTLPHASLSILARAAAVEVRHLPIPHPNSERKGGNDA